VTGCSARVSASTRTVSSQHDGLCCQSAPTITVLDTRHECAAVRGTDWSRGGGSGVNNSPTDSALTADVADVVPRERELRCRQEPSNRDSGPVRGVRGAHRECALGWFACVYGPFFARASCVS
jgi:hypothetical protein